MAGSKDGNSPWIIGWLESREEGSVYNLTQVENSQNYEIDQRKRFRAMRYHLKAEWHASILYG